jgi:hypothetical protein
MFRLSKSVLSFGAGAVAIGALILIAPRAAHAVAATLVQVTNTTASPAITQSTNTQASQLVTLILPVNTALPPNSGLVAMYQFLAPSGPGATPYTVPAGQHLVVTGMDVNLAGGAAYIQLYLPWNGGAWAISNAFLSTQGFQQIQYPSGIVFDSGSQVYVQNGGNSGTADIAIHGYLSAN